MVFAVFIWKIQLSSVVFFPRGGPLWGLLTAGRGGVCVRVCTKVEVTPLLTFFAPKGHTLFRRMQKPRLMDDRSGCFPGFILTREIVIHPLGEAEDGAGPLFCSALIFSWIQDAMKRLRAQLPWQGFKERWSKSWTAAVPSLNSTELCWAEDWRPYMVQPKIQFVFLLWCFIIVYTPLMHSCSFTHIVCHQRMWWQDDAPVTQCLVWMWLSLSEKNTFNFLYCMWLNSVNEWCRWPSIPQSEQSCNPFQGSRSSQLLTSQSATSRRTSAASCNINI